LEPERRERVDRLLVEVLRRVAMLPWIATDVPPTWSAGRE
jgi:hypothetical protein